MSKEKVKYIEDSTGRIAKEKDFTVYHKAEWDKIWPISCVIVHNTIFRLDIQCHRDPIRAVVGLSSALAAGSLWCH